MPKQEHYRTLVLRSTVTADDVAIVLTAAAGALAKASNAVELIPNVTYAEIFFWGTTGGGTDADTNVNLYGWYQDSTPTTIMMGTWSLTLGTQVATTLPEGTAVTSGLYVDTIVADTDSDYWGAVIRDSATNHICRLALDLRGLRYLYAEFINVAVGANEIETIGALYRAY